MGVSSSIGSLSGPARSYGQVPACGHATEDAAHGGSRLGDVVNDLLEGVGVVHG